MADMIELQPRHAPWKPTPDTTVVVEYEYYDVPLSGVLRQGGREYLFTCIDGQDEPISLWWYAAIDSSQRTDLEAAEGEEFRKRLRSMELHGWSRLALASDVLGIMDFEDVEDSTAGAQDALRALKRRLKHEQREAQRLELVR